MDSGSVPDSELVKRCTDGDDEAFEMLYNRYRLQLYSYLNKLLPGQTATVDDLFQQTWVKVLDVLPRYQDKNRFLSWVFRIAHNLAIDHFRRESRQEFVEVHERIPDEGTVPWDRVHREELKSSLADALAELSEEQREVVVLRQQGVPFKEIAEIQEVSINTVLGRMHYAVKRLRSVLVAKFS